MRVEHYIVELLYRHNCIVVPGFGAFLANTTPAVLNTSTNTLTPPFKRLSFNQQLSKNDGLLISHIAKLKKLPYDDLVEEVAEASREWTKKIQNGEKLRLEGIGALWMDRENKILFNPEDRTNYLTDSFGLSEFSAIPITREAFKKEVEEIEERVPFIITPEKRETSSFRPLLKYAAVLLLMVSLGTSAYLNYKRFENNQIVVEQNAQNQVSRHIQEATFFDAAPLELPPLKINVEKKIAEITGPRHHIIAGAFRIRQNADKKIAQLKRQGYNAEYIGANRYGLHQVTYGTFKDKYEALRFLREVKRNVSPDAWMLSVK